MLVVVCVGVVLIIDGIGHGVGFNGCSLNQF